MPVCLQVSQLQRQVLDIFSQVAVVLLSEVIELQLAMAQPPLVIGSRAWEVAELREQLAALASLRDSHKECAKAFWKQRVEGELLPFAMDLVVWLHAHNDQD